MTDISAPARPRLIEGIDSLRFAAALWVTFSHYAESPLESLFQGQGKVFTLLHAIPGLLFNGLAAVVVFFLISGFCIHYPNVNKDSLNWRTFLLRRITRIGIPLILVVVIAYLLGADYMQSLNIVLWTVYCELIYYVLYPVLHWARRYVKLTHMMLGFTVVSLVVAVLNLKVQYLWQFGIWLTWLFCYPAWILGAILAERINLPELKKVPLSIWLWRAAAIGYGVFMTICFYHLPKVAISFMWTIIPFVPFCYLWLQKEITEYQPSAIRNVLEKAGMASYSLYLVHKIAITLVEQHAMGLGGFACLGILIVLMPLVTVAFYFAVERTSHRLAKSIG